jgi:hypothetical protein
MLLPYVAVTQDSLLSPDRPSKGKRYNEVKQKLEAGAVEFHLLFNAEMRISKDSLAAFLSVIFQTVTCDLN